MNPLQPMYCPKCKTLIDATDRVCVSCGESQIPPVLRPVPRQESPSVSANQVTRNSHPSADDSSNHSSNRYPTPDLAQNVPPFFFNETNRRQLVSGYRSPWITGNEIFGFGLAILFLIVGIGFSWGGVSLWWDMHGLEQGHEIQGRVLSAWVNSGTTNDDSIRDDTMVRYEYAVGGKEYTATSYFPKDDVRKFKYGAPVTIRYSATTPSQMMSPDWYMVKHREAGSAFVPIGMGLGVTALMVLMIKSIVNNRSQRRRREEQGRHLRGQIVSCTAKEDSDDDLMMTVHYSFESPSERTCVGQSRGCFNALKGKMLPPPGTPVWILYLNDNDYELL